MIKRNLLENIKKKKKLNNIFSLEVFNFVKDIYFLLEDGNSLEDAFIELAKSNEYLDNSNNFFSDKSNIYKNALIFIEQSDLFIRKEKNYIMSQISNYLGIPFFPYEHVKKGSSILEMEDIFTETNSFKAMENKVKLHLENINNDKMIPPNTILYGPPGTGKTIHMYNVARILSEKNDVFVFKITPAVLKTAEDMKRLKEQFYNLFNYNKNAFTIFFIDEIDLIFSQENDSPIRGSLMIL
jgi:ATP-dependent Zn protease